MLKKQGFDDAIVFPVGDSLQNPFWPQGLGVNLGFHGILDAVWSTNLWSQKKDCSLVEEEQINAFACLRYHQQFINMKPGEAWTSDPFSRLSEQIFKARHHVSRLEG
jgi:hypothetical protein